MEIFFYRSVDKNPNFIDERSAYFDDTKEVFMFKYSSKHAIFTNGLPTDFDWNKIFLFENTLKIFFNEIETGTMLIKPNDWYDLFLLVYVNPNRKIWTRDRKVKRIITKAGLENYLYEK